METTFTINEIAEALDISINSECTKEDVIQFLRVLRYSMYRIIGDDWSNLDTMAVDYLEKTDGWDNVENAINNIIGYKKVIGGW